MTPVDPSDPLHYAFDVVTLKRAGVGVKVESDTAETVVTITTPRAAVVLRDDEVDTVRDALAEILDHRPS
jgi:hypothetical protein